MIKLRIEWSDCEDNQQVFERTENDVWIEDSERVGQILALLVESQTVRPWLVVSSLVESMERDDPCDCEVEAIEELVAAANKLIEGWRSRDAQFDHDQSSS
jgi:hypothetical protein